MLGIKAQPDHADRRSVGEEVHSVMRFRKTGVAVLIAAILLGPQAVWADDAEEVTDIPIPVQEETVEETTTQPVTQSTTKAAGNQQAASVNPAVIGVVSGYQFTDGTVDVWYTASGAAVTDTAAVTAATSVSYMDQSALSTKLNTKKAAYSRLGIDLSDYDTVRQSMVTYICKADGSYSQTRVLYYDADTQIALLDTSGLNIKPLDGAASYSGDSYLCGYSLDSLAKAGEGIKTQAKASALTQLTFAYAGFSGQGAVSPAASPDTGFVGGAVLTPDGKLCGITTAISGQTVTVSKYDQIQKTVSSASASSSQDSTREQALEDLQAAIDHAATLDVSGYTDESAAALAEALTDARITAQDPSASSADLSAAEGALTGAEQALAQKPAGQINKKRLLFVGALGLLILVCLVVLAVFLLKGGKKTESKPEKAERKTDKKPKPGRKAVNGKKASKEAVDGAYGGELARQSSSMKNPTGAVDDGEAETTLLNDGDGEAETTLLQENVKAYLTDEYGNRIDITKRDFVIGKERKKVSYCIANSTVSRRHCVIKNDPDGITLEDLGSLNGTTLNGIRVEKGTPVSLHDGDIIALSDVTLVFHTGV